MATGTPGGRTITGGDRVLPSAPTLYERPTTRLVHDWATGQSKVVPYEHVTGEVQCHKSAVDAAQIPQGAARAVPSAAKAAKRRTVRADAESEVDPFDVAAEDDGDDIDFGDAAEPAVETPSSEPTLIDEPLLAPPVPSTPEIPETTMTDTTSTPGPVKGEDYAAQVAALLVETEGHPDPIVRDLRRVVVQAARALRSVTDATTAEVPTSPATLAVVVDDRSGMAKVNTAESAKKARATKKSSVAKKAPGKKAAKTSAVAGTPDPSAVRAWAVANGHTVADRGRIRADITAAYLEAHPVAS